MRTHLISAQTGETTQCGLDPQAVRAQHGKVTHFPDKATCTTCTAAQNAPTARPPKGALYKTTVVIWSKFNPHGLELSQLTRDAESGESYCSSLQTHLVEKPADDPAWDGTEFFEIGASNERDRPSDRGLSDGGVIEAPDAEGTIRRRDVHGNLEDVIEPSDPRYTQMIAQFFPDVFATHQPTIKSRRRTVPPT